jgi:hypothetical protein
MQLIEDILKYRSCSIVGMEKNTGKTECLNYILCHLPIGIRVALTSIGIDGEQQDQVTRTSKPEICLWPGMLFATSEAHYLQKQLSAEVLKISDESTSLGNVVIARALTVGRVMLSGPATAAGLRRWMGEMQEWEVDLTLVDGALSRKSSASPAVSESMVLATGAAYSADMRTLVQHTAFVAELAHLPLAEEREMRLFGREESGIWMQDREGEWRKLPVASSLQLRSYSWKPASDIRCLYVSGALTDSLMELMQRESVLKNADLLVRDFTKVFVSPLQYRLFLKRGRQVRVLQTTQLVAVCVNPTSPSGYTLNSERLCAAMAEAVQVPVYDLRKGTERFL